MGKLTTMGVALILLMMVHDVDDDQGAVTKVHLNCQDIGCLFQKNVSVG